MPVTVVELVQRPSDDVLQAFARLLPQLTDPPPRLTLADLEAMIAAPGTFVLVARDADHRIVGSVTLLCHRIPSGFRGRIESLVVDEGARGKGVGRALCLAAIEHATRVGVTMVDLTSSHSRVAANALYQSLGFERRASNVYRYRIG
ncbi:MAG TPA: GNAT family N-acetyltransferase [Polyangia bacterium]